MKESLASVVKHGPSALAAWSDQQTTSTQKTVIRQGGNGLGSVIAALILAVTAVYAINVW